MSRACGSGGKVVQRLVRVFFKIYTQLLPEGYRIATMPACEFLNHAPASQKKDEDSSSSSSSSESEDDATTCVSRRNRDGTASSASAHELALLDALTQGGSRLAAGRFGGREGKMSRIRAQEAREAAAAAAALGTAVPDGRTSKSKKARSDADARPASQEPAAPRIVVEVHSAEASAAAAAAAALWRPTELEGWWGRGMFSPAGVLEGMRKAQEDAKRGFTEDDQVEGGPFRGMGWHTCLLCTPFPLSCQRQRAARAGL